MKKILLTLLSAALILITAVSFAQPILTAAGINPVVGESFTLMNTGYVSPGSAGASQTWNLSSMTGSSAGLTSVVTPSSTTSGSSFPSANVAANNPTGGIVNYYYTSSSALQNYGVVAGATVIPNSNPEDFLHFPFAFNNTFSDPWAATFVSSGYTWYRTGTTTVTADSYGTLITPGGTYLNVMRVHFVQVYQDSTYVGAPYLVTYNNDEYMWYANGTHTQLAVVYTLTASAGGPYTGGSYINSSVGVNDVSNYIISSNVFPNPAANQLTVDFTLTESRKVDVQVFNTLGQQSEINQSADGISGENTIKLDVSGLPEGIYFAQIVLDGNIAATKRFVVSK